ncbi:MAG: ribonuclease T, partial [Gemmobacter sp.]|nr:ribonuclease T [Gemmobacter sp.]
MRVILVALLLALTVLPAQAEGERAGDFDYYLLALSWSPNWCRLVGDAGSAPECRTGAGRTFTLHGLWPQNETGWPSHCHTAERDPSRQESAEMADIMGSSALAWYQWT